MIFGLGQIGKCYIKTKLRVSSVYFLKYKRMKTQELSIALKNIQSECIGLWQNHISRNIELVIEADDITFKTVTIGDLFGMCTTTIAVDSSYPPIKYFPDGKTLTDMLKTPFEFNEWFTENIVKSNIKTK